MRTRFLLWCLFFAPAAAAVLAWNAAYYQTAAMTGLAAGIGLVWFVRAWDEPGR